MLNIVHSPSEGGREKLAPASVALAMRIPVAHIEDGEVSQGAIDDAVRNALTKLAHIHFTSTETARLRVISMGEEPWRVHRAGAPSIDHLRRSPLLDRAALDLDDVLAWPTDARAAVLHEVDELERLMGGTVVEPLATFGARWLRHHAPHTLDRVVLLQGDTGPGNFLFEGDRLTAVVDFEWAHFGDPMEDFGNMAAVQKGMKSRGYAGPRPSPAQELSVIHFHRLLARYMGTGAPRPIR